MIVAEGLGVRFGNTPALKHLDLQFGEGVTGLFGENGSGKSTLLRVLAGLLRPTSGRILIDGLEADFRDEGLRARIGYAGHGSGLYPRLSLRENLRLFAGLYGAPDPHVDATLERLRLTDRADTPVAALSAGYRRRGAVARALVHDPVVLLLDEPYANLDEEAQAITSEAIVSWRKPGRCAIVASHGAKKVKRYADAGVILRRGELRVAGSYRSPGHADA